MGIIEQAAKRLEELRRAGVETPGIKDRQLEATGDAAVAARPRTPERAMQALEAAGGDVATVGPKPAAAAPRVDARVVGPDAAPQPVPARRSKEVTLDLGRLAANGFISPNAARTQLADEFRVLKRPLLANAQGRSAAPVERGNLIMITSALPGEGKTFTAINLALSMAMELDNTVLLVDADVARPAVLDRLGLQASRGLLDLLTSREVDVADVLLKTNVEKLSILPAGRPHGRATEFLASDAMDRLVGELASHYPDRILIFDAPPLLGSTESRVLATHMGQVVVVVEAERTSQAALTQALATVENCPVVMTMLNKVRRSGVGSYYGYYGGYGYGS